ncbi:NEDD4-binding protein 2 [Diplodia seriata]|uniref:NEDD4-binding protein 2 n=3 Tax=Diplodia seriata TaxID=420778 RepID=A0A1S8BIM7_9PEZI|nr:NEDD4-binding protein 2 [Diplodia seriata]
MVSDEIYDLCLPVLQDDSLEDEDKTEQLEELVREKTSLSGKALEDAVLDSLWRFRGSSNSSASPPPVRHTIIRRSSPAPWQVARAPTPSSSSPRIAPPPGFGVAPPGFSRAKSSTASPFTSPRPSPRMAYATPHIPHSPNLNAYEFSEPSHTPDIYGDYGSDTVDWLVNDDVASVSSSLHGDGSLNGAAAEWVQPYTMDMDPYDMLRSILRDNRSNDEIERALEENGYDFTATVQALMDQSAALQQPTPVNQPEKTYLVGKSMSPSFRPSTPAGQIKTNVLCKYWLTTGHCARADCRFSHDPSKTVCKYWLAGNCLAGDTCLFSHDPTSLMSKMMLEGSSTPPQPNFQVQDYEAFPSLQQTASHHSMHSHYAEQSALEQLYGVRNVATPPPGLSPFPTFTPSSHRTHSRPSSSRQISHSRASTPSAPAADDPEAFPSLASAAAAKGGKKHHGKRGGHGHVNKDGSAPNTLADVVKMSPSPAPAQPRKGLRPAKSFNGTRENSAAAQAIPAPEHIPWLETGDSANKAYLKARQEAFKHGGLRNKFLQSAAQAWNRNDSRAAKALSLRGQSENNLMRQAHREAAEHLYNERNKDNSPNAKELYVDLHGLHPEESVQYLSKILMQHQNSTRPIYAITGTGHHSKNGKDKVGKAVRGFLNEWRYVFREFSVPGDRGNVGGILGIDPSSWDRSLERERLDSGVGSSNGEDDKSGDKLGESTKIRVIKAEQANAGGVPTGPRVR